MTLNEIYEALLSSNENKKLKKIRKKVKNGGLTYYSLKFGKNF